MRKKCQAVATSTGEKCKRGALPRSRYCHFHIEKVPLLLGAIVGALLGLFASEIWSTFVPSEATKRISRVEEQLKPFIELAQKRFPNSETDEALEKLRQGLSEVKQLAEQPKMIFKSHMIHRVREGYLLTIQFKKSKNEPLGTIRFKATIPNGSRARILKFDPDRLAMDLKRYLSSDSLVCTLQYAIPGSRDPVVKLYISSATLIRLEGSHGFDPIIIDVQ